MTRLIRSALPPSFGGVAATLRIGTLAAVGAVAVGLAWATVSGADGRSNRSLLELLATSGPDAVIAFGMLGLALVPIAALGTAAVTFARAGEPRSAAVAASVLALLLASLVTALVVGTPNA